MRRYNIRSRAFRAEALAKHPAPKPKPQVEHLVDMGVHQCMDCGAHASRPEWIEHYSTCEPGSARRWEEFYARPDIDNI